MPFDKLFGHEEIKTYLSKALDEPILSQTLLFHGPDGVGKKLFARVFAAALLRVEEKNLSLHPDMHELFPESKSGLYPIEELRKFTAKVYEAPFSGKQKVFLLHEADRMQAPSANALLKTLEEPALDATIILVTSRPKDLLPTILSRCIQLQFQALRLQEIEHILQEKGFSVDGAVFAQGSASLALSLAQEGPFMQAQKRLLALLERASSYPDILDELEAIDKLFEKVKEEDPVAYARQTRLLCSLFLMWARDQMVHEVGGGELYFPSLSKADRKIRFFDMQKRVEEMTLGLERHLKLSTCLQRAFF